MHSEEKGNQNYLKADFVKDVISFINGTVVECNTAYSGAIDQACLDLVYNSEDPGKQALIDRIESLHGVHTIEVASELGNGTREYELITI